MSYILVYLGTDRKRKHAPNSLTKCEVPLLGSKINVLLSIVELFIYYKNVKYTKIGKKVE